MCTLGKCVGVNAFITFNIKLVSIQNFKYVVLLEIQFWQKNTFPYCFNEYYLNLNAIFLHCKKYRFLKQTNKKKKKRKKNPTKNKKLL